MPVTPNLEKTLTAGQETLLHLSRFTACRVTLTGISGEFATIPFRTKTVAGIRDSGLFEASQVRLSFVQCLISGAIFATTPAGVATLDIVYELRTGRDA